MRKKRRNLVLICQILDNNGKKKEPLKDQAVILVYDDAVQWSKFEILVLSLDKNPQNAYNDYK